MVEMTVVIYDKSYTEDEWFKCILSFEQFDYLIEHCSEIEEVYAFLGMLGLWRRCEEPMEYRGFQGSGNDGN